MSDFFDDQTLSIPCAKCGHETEEKVSRLNDSPKITCSKCGATTEVDLTKFAKAFWNAEKMGDDFGAKISKPIKIGQFAKSIGNAEKMVDGFGKKISKTIKLD